MAKRSKSKKEKITIPESDIWNTILDEKAQRDKLKKEEEKQAAREERKRLREEIKAELKERKRLEREAKKAAKKKKPVVEEEQQPVIEEENKVEEPIEEETPVEIIPPVIQEIKVIEVEPNLEKNFKVNMYKYVSRIVSALLLMLILLYFFESGREYKFVKYSSANYNIQSNNNITSFDVEFNYNEVYPTEKETNYNYYVKSNIVTKSNKDIYKKEETLSNAKSYTNSGKVVNITEKVNVPIDKYNEYAKRFESDKSKLTVSLVLVNDGKEEVVSSINMILLEDKNNIEKELINNETGTYTVETNIWIRLVLLSSIFFIIEFALYSVVKMFIFVLKPIFKPNK